MPTAPRIIPLDNIGPEHGAVAGGKAYECARLKQAGFAVPDGLVVLAHATAAEIAQLPHLTWFDRQPIDARYAVRSSALDEDGAEQSFAGIHDTRLNVAREDVVAAVDVCRASVQSAQALAYRRAKGMDVAAIQTGVLVQRMIEAVAAGVAFTIDPLTGATDAFVINAAPGLGEALVSGRIDPDEFYVRKADGAIVSARIGERAGQPDVPSLSVALLRELGTILCAIERHYGVPQDVEWCHDGRQFWIVQSRPVTAGVRQPTGTEWTRANFVEVLPELTSPQALDALEDLLNRAERQLMGSLIARDSELGPMVKVFCGRLYFNLSQLRRVCAIGGMPAASVLRSMGHQGIITPADEVPEALPLGERLKHLPALLHIASRHLRIGALVRRHERALADVLDRWSRIDPDAAPDGVLWGLMNDWTHEGPNHMQIVLTLGGVLFYEAPLRRICESVGMPFERLVYPQLASGERSVSAQQAFDILLLADTARRDPAVVSQLLDERLDTSALRHPLQGTAFLAAFDRFLDRYGHRGIHETDWALPRFREDPAPILSAIREHVRAPSGRTPADIAARQAQEAADAWRDFEGRLTWWQRLTLLPRARFTMRRIKQYYVWRERCRFEMMQVIGQLRAWHLSFARRFVARGWLDDVDQYFLVTRAEVGAALADPSSAQTLRAIAVDRGAERDRLRKVTMPLLMHESELPRLIRTAGLSGVMHGDELRGHGVSGGRVEGEVAVILDPTDFGRMRQGAILVTRATDPSWTPLFTLAAGVIVEVGGVLSHASTIAREFGLPAVANVKHATKILRTGERVLLDANAGVVRRLTSAGARREGGGSRDETNAETAEDARRTRRAESR